MSGSDKPFACTSEGCQMTFTNEDHLNVHQKKHDMVLNLGIVCKNNVFADQTPTPTRFIRNCEEVGLFQDLQNVNPFEETFKKAIEQSKNGTVHVPESSSDDTLHTPHIFPHVTEASVGKFGQTECESQDFNITNIVATDDSLSISRNSELEESHRSVQESNNDTSPASRSINVYSRNTNLSSLTNSPSEHIINNPYLKVPEKLDATSNIKEKIKVALQSKQKELKSTEGNVASSIHETQKNMNSEQTSIILPRKPRKRANLKHKAKNLNENAKEIKHRDNGVLHNISFYDKNLNEVEKRRAMNRMAQMRSRERKKLWLDQVEKDMSKLKDENKRLSLENSSLKDENVLLKTILLNGNNCSLSTMEEIKTFLNVQKLKQIKNGKGFSPIEPKLTQTTTSLNTLIKEKFTNIVAAKSPSLKPKFVHVPIPTNKRKASSDDKINNFTKLLPKSNVDLLTDKNNKTQQLTVPQSTLTSVSKTMPNIVNTNFIKEPSKTVTCINLPHVILDLKTISEGTTK